MPTKLNTTPKAISALHAAKLRDTCLDTTNKVIETKVSDPTNNKTCSRKMCIINAYQPTRPTGEMESNLPKTPGTFPVKHPSPLMSVGALRNPTTSEMVSITGHKALKIFTKTNE